eukprot:CAMPEP_0119320830 /NCGR_PEP_ID=MMETSP1333-20130426/53577_1 /TAXON_ID=418940 /ORGANISM="Scyphosphaera apsteinii, Strain RCC1455" /LENGTH=211 /DNA_ID=CAMNT_0007327641 /DNA_START=293 /DNA_END=928 /DNA_ORIENTATION=-
MSYERVVTLPKPLGIVLGEVGDCRVRIEEFQPGGSAATSGLDIAPGDVLLKIGETDVSAMGFDSIMEIILAQTSPVSLTVTDGLPRLDITPNLANSLKPQDAVLADLVVRAAVRECRRITGASAELKEALGELLRVEILLGAGVRPDGRCLVRFFGIFSRSGDSSNTYSCNIAAAGVKRADGRIEIMALSCAKDEGWGRTIDLKRDDSDAT